jgi:hypothetical protein
MTTITSTGQIIKPKKAPKIKAPSIGKTRVKGEIRHFPPYTEGMSTMVYIEAYHAANSHVMLTMPEYTCQ